jgi:acetoin utilization deacetylase AcuC-like enzyme
MDVIGLVHDKKYTDYVNNIWDPKKHKKAIKGDTYFNQHSNVASHLAVGGVLAGVDNIMNKRWRNAFAVVRPPGHHSGVKNVISGFCIYNNVAIGVHYLRKKYNKVKIAIFDWDVHHGDGTQHVFR